MDYKNSHFVAALVGAAAVLVSASSAACSLAPTDPIRIKQMMAREIAHRLGISPQRVPLNAISLPKLHSPFPLGADCSGLGAFHHSAGFRWAEGWRPGPGPGPWPRPRPDPRQPWPDRAPGPDGTGTPSTEPDNPQRPERGPEFRPPHAQCSYEGVAVVLGYGYSSPVAVNFERRCR